VNFSLTLFLRQSFAMSTIGKTLHVKGEIRSAEDLIVEGHVEGHVFCETGCVVLGPTSDVKADVLARDITVHGKLTGQLVATDVVDVRADGSVLGQVISKRFILDPAANFKGRVEPQHLDAAVNVAKFHQKKREGAG
jgi:cytoskeletal protein CcmA (bactofilin family)